MRHAMLTALALALTLQPGRAEELADHLPSDTVVYAYLDAGTMLKQLGGMLTTLDPKNGLQVLHEGLKIHGALMKLAEDSGFAPQILRNPLSLKTHFILLPLAEPVVHEEIFQTPVWDEGGLVEGEFEEEKIIERRYFSMAVVLECEEMKAADLAMHIRSLAERIMKEDGLEAEVWKELETTQGTWLQAAAAELVLGRMGRYVVIAPHDPQDLRKALATPARPGGLTADPVYLRMQGRCTDPMLWGMANIESLVSVGRRYIADARADDGEQAGHRAASARRAADSLETTLDFCTRAFSLDQMESVALWTDYDVSTEGVATHSGFTLHIPGQLTPMMEALLSGGAKLDPPKLASFKGMVLMSRAGLSEIVEQLPSVLPEEAATSYEAMRMNVKQMAKTDWTEFAAMMAGDSYILLDYVQSEVEIPRWDEEEQQVKQITMKQPMPRGSWVLGLRDDADAATWLADLHKNLQPMGFGNFFRKKQVADQDVYMLGPEMAEDFVMVATKGRYFFLGHREQVTAALEQEGLQEGDWDEVAAKHRQAAVLAVFPKRLSVRINEMTDYEQQVELMTEAFEAVEWFEEGNQEAKEQLLESGTKLYRKYMEWARNAMTRGDPNMVIHVKRDGPFCDMKGDTFLPAE
ncbi:MAG: hypothetical protein GF311_27485 [Candidatus Lokiarchaeota archaeon]|nr:hypothetical protein [Candidatus Lokiarchaeota archaeon]